MTATADRTDRATLVLNRLVAELDRVERDGSPTRVTWAWRDMLRVEGEHPHARVVMGEGTAEIIANLLRDRFPAR